MRSIPKENEIYKHFKGNDYQIVTIAYDSETDEQMVVYKALYGEGKTYVRSLEMFMSEVDHDKYPDATQTYRFEKEEFAVDPQVMEFLDARTASERLDILKKLEQRITDSMIDTMAIAMDIAINEGPVEERLRELRVCLNTISKYETTRLRS